jgi:hypothetical protein
MKVSIIGAGKNRSGIGEHIAKYFHKNGANVVSVLGTTERTTRSASLALSKYGIKAHPYTDFDEMVENEWPDSIAIASPSRTHYEYLAKCIDLGLNIFCEKPFVWEEGIDTGKAVEDILKKASEKELTIAMNSQWPFSIEYYEKICGKIEIKKANQFSIHLSPSSSGKEMIPESVPHALSLLYHMFGDGGIKDLNFELNGEREITIRFTYMFAMNECDVLIELTSQESQPRDFSFGFNGKMVLRSLDFENYNIYFNYGNKKLKITDPLDLSIKNFIKAVEKKEDPLIGHPHILNTMSLLKKIYDGYTEFEKRNLWKS